MTLLLFLASLVVTEYLLRDSRKKTNGRMSRPSPPPDETSTGDLVSLARALDAQAGKPVENSAAASEKLKLPAN